MSLPWVWGATTAEAERAYPADDAVDGPVLRMTRAIDVAAPPELTWRWLCQVSVAPYSYDLIDNLGRRSPRELTPGADRLEVGQSIAVVLTLTHVDPPHQWTARTSARGDLLFGPTAMTYAAESAPGGSRIVARVAVGVGGRLGRQRAGALAWGDLVMIRKQLRTLKALAEGTD